MYNTNKKINCCFIVKFSILMLPMLILVGYFTTLSEDILYSIAILVLGGVLGVFLGAADKILFNNIQKNIDSDKPWALVFGVCSSLIYSAFLAITILILANYSPETSTTINKFLLATLVGWEVGKKLAEIREKPQPNTIMIPSDRGDLKLEFLPNRSGREIDFTRPQEFTFTSDDKAVKIHITS